MKRWKLLTVLAIIVLMNVAATKVPYLSRDGTETTTVTVTSDATDSLFIYDTTLVKCAGFNYLRYRMIFAATGDSILGARVIDSLVLRLEVLRSGIWLRWDSTMVKANPRDTLEGVILKADGDTLLNEYVRFLVYYFDTLQDTSATATYDITLDLFAKVSP